MHLMCERLQVGSVVSCPATNRRCVTGERTPHGGPPDPRHRHSERGEADPTILTHESCGVKGKPWKLSD